MRDEDKHLLETRAFEIYLKKLPSTSLTESTAGAFRSAAEQALEMAQIFTKVFRDTLSDQLYEKAKAEDQRNSK